MAKRVRRLVAVAVCMCLLLPTSASSYQRPGITERATLAPGGLEANGPLGLGDASEDGRYVAFSSKATNLVEGDTSWTDVYLHDRLSDEITKITYGFDGSLAIGNSSGIEMSDDGSVIVFRSSAPNLISNDTNETSDIFVWTNESGIERVSVGTGGVEPDGPSQNQTMSDDGRFIVFSTRDTKIVENNPDGQRHILVHDRHTGVTESVTRTPEGNSPNGPSFFSDISDDGRYVVFDSFATDIVQGDTNGWTDVFLHDRVTGTTEKLSLGHDGSQVNSPATNPDISGNGRFVKFQSSASNLVPGVHDSFPGYLYVVDRATGRIERVSLRSDGTEADSGGFLGDISDDGRYVYYSSWADTLTPQSANGTIDAFLYDREFGTTELISQSSDGAIGDGHSLAGSMEGDPRVLLFASLASNMVSDDTNGHAESFFRNRGPATGPFSLHVESDEGVITVLGSARSESQRLLAATDPDDEDILHDADVIAAELISRPEEKDLFVRIELSGMRNVLGNVSPGLVWGVDLDTSTGRNLQVRAQPKNRIGAARGALYDCTEDELCTYLADVGGGVGSTGAEVVLSIPAGYLSGVSAVSNVQVWSALGLAETPPEAKIDTISLGSVVLPMRDGAVGIAPAGVGPGAVESWESAEVLDGSFEGSLDISRIAPGSYEVWARVCYGQVCGFDSMAVEIADQQPRLETDILLEFAKDKGDVLLSTTLVDEFGQAVANKTVIFEVNGQEVGRAPTDVTGMAGLRIHRNEIKGGDVVTVRFEGDESYGSSTQSNEVPQQLVQTSD